MRLNRVRGGWLSALTCALLALGPMAYAQQDALQKLVDLRIKDGDLLTATQALTAQTGIQFVVAPSDKPFERINLSLTGRTAEEAIQLLCLAAGGWAERQENGVFIIRRGPKPEPREVTNPAPTNPVRAPRLEVVRKIRLMKADPELVFQMLTAEYRFDPVQGIRQLNRFSSEARGDIGTIQGGNLTVVTNGQAMQPTVYPQVAGSRNEPFRTEEAGNGVVLPGEGALQGQPPGFGGGGGGQGGGQGQPGGQGTLQEGQGLVPNGIDFISWDPTDNSIVVRGDDEAVRRLQQNIALFDVAPQQVEIKVEFVTTSQSVSRSLGFDWLYSRGAVFAGNRPGSFARNGDPIFLNYATGNVTTRLRTLLLEGQGRVVNAPLVRTLNNQIALVAQAVETTIFINQVINGPGGITTVPQPVQFSVNTQLVVRPRINGDGTVTMNLTPQIQDFGQLRRGPDGQEIPDRLSQVINVVARVRSGETIALAGLTRKSDQSSQSRFPILGDLPIIGQFFRSNTRERNTSDLLIFVTPTIIDEETGAGVNP